MPIVATVALAYKGLWMVEDTIRTAKSILDTRPIFHKCDETIRGHVFCSFLALRLKAELERRLAARAVAWEWAEVVRGLDNLQEVEAMFQGRRYMLRSQLTGHAHKAIQAAGGCSAHAAANLKTKAQSENVVPRTFSAS